MGWGEPLRARPHPAGGIVVEVAAADHLAKVEAERDALRSVLRDVLTDTWECTAPTECECSHARAHRLLNEVADRG